MVKNMNAGPPLFLYVIPVVFWVDAIPFGTQISNAEYTEIISSASSGIPQFNQSEIKQVNEHQIKTDSGIRTDYIRKIILRKGSISAHVLKSHPHFDIWRKEIEDEEANFRY